MFLSLPISKVSKSSVFAKLDFVFDISSPFLMLTKHPFHLQGQSGQVLEATVKR